MAQAITFILPDTRRAPAGGYKVVYEYANRLAERGYRVTVIHAANPSIDASLGAKLKSFLRYLKYWRTGDALPRRWFDFNPAVVLRWVPSLAQKYIPAADFVVATAWRTSEWVAGYEHTRGKKLYLLQSYEDWDGPSDRVAATWKMPLHKIVISRWLLEIAGSVGEQATYIPNGLNHDEFYDSTPLSQRKPASVMMLYHHSRLKGSADGIAALAAVKLEVPELEATLFGVPDRPNDLPAWIKYEQKPFGKRLCALYNEHALFLAPSWKEGWGLTPAESMQCGCAVVAADNGGHREFAIHGKTALVAEPGDVAQFTRHLITLINDGEQRTAIAEQGRQWVQQFTWGRSIDLFEQLLQWDD